MQGQDVLLANRYRLERVIGHGGMAEVWAAQDEVLERPVAVKVMSDRFSADAQFQQRFRREAQQAASLNHPNIVKVYDTGDHDGLPFIVMELVVGRSLQQILASGGLIEERALEVVADCCGALAYAHDRGLIHRDVKPGNILLADDGTVKVTDFGIARAIDSETVTQTAAVLGTAAYLSPEQAQGARVDARSDVYSLGVVLYELLVGEQPFQSDSAVGVAYQHVQEDAIPPRELNPEVSAAAEAIAMKAMAKNPTNRYAGAGQMREDVLRAAAGRPVRAPAVMRPDETAILDAEVLSSRPRPPRTETQERRRHRVGYVLLAVLTALAFVAGIWLVASMLQGEEVPLRTVPSTTNLTFENARQALEARGLVARYAGDDFSEDVPDGHVMRQEPDGGARVRDGSVVELTLSKGPEPIAVPDVEGLAEEEAIATLRNAGLSIGDRRTAFSEEFEKGLVIGTDPPRGETVTRNTPVQLVVSAGEETAIVPSVVGLHESDARFRLEEAGFVPIVVHEFSDAIDEGRVISQDPDGNERAEVGADVAIVISQGPSAPEPEPPPEPTEPSEPEPTPTPPSSPPPDEPSGEPTPGPTESPS